MSDGDMPGTIAITPAGPLTMTAGESVVLTADQAVKQWRPSDTAKFRVRTLTTTSARVECLCPCQGYIVAKTGRASGHVDINVQPAPVPCTYTLAPTSLVAPAAGGVTTIAVQTSAGCAWTATTGDAWIGLSPTSGTGPGTVTVTVGASATARSGSATIAGLPLPVTQQAAAPGPSGFAQVIAGIRPRGYAAVPYVLETPTAGRVTYYVAPTGSDTAAGGSADPFRTINRAAQVAIAGDVVTIRNGTYQESVSVRNAGTGSAPIVFQAENRGGVILTGGAYCWQPLGWMNGKMNSGPIYVTLKGLVFDQYAANVAGSDAVRAIKGWRIEDCFFDHPGDQAANLRGDEIAVVRCTFQYAFRHAIGAWGPANSATGPDDPVHDGITNLQILDCILTENHTNTVPPVSGSESAVAKIIASKNLLIDNLESHHNNGPGLWLDSANFDYTITNSYFHDNRSPGAGFSPGRGLHLEISWRGVVRNNVFASNAIEGLALNNVSGVEVDTNLFNGNGSRCIVMTAGDRGVRYPLENLTIHDNQFRDWAAYAAIEPLLSATNPAYPAAHTIVVTANIYDPIRSAVLSGWWGYFISTLVQNCSDLGWDCTGSSIAPITWPPV